MYASSGRASATGSIVRRQGRASIVTERGIPKVRVVAATAESIVERLVREGRATPADPRPRRPVADRSDTKPCDRHAPRAASREGLLILYFDASAFVKLLLVEEGSNTARGLWNADTVLLTSWITFAETTSAVTAAARSRRISRRRATAAVRRSEAEWTVGHRARRRRDHLTPSRRPCGTTRPSGDGRGSPCLCDAGRPQRIPVFVTLGCNAASRHEPRALELAVS